MGGRGGEEGGGGVVTVRLLSGRCVWRYNVRCCHERFVMRQCRLPY